MNKLALALDWTPNTNHTGFFLAANKGYYKDEGIGLEIIDPSVDNYQTTPAKKLERGEVDFALAPFESVISYRTKAKPFPAKAIATLLKNDISAIATLKTSGIDAPHKLDGKIYASYKARYEDEIVREMVRNDGGKGDFDILYPEKLNIWNILLNKRADATWIFLNWEGFDEEAKKVEINTFKMGDYGVPYGYSPVILTSEEMIEDKGEVISRFLKATKKGFMEAKNHPQNGMFALSDHVPEIDRERIDLSESQRFTAGHYGNEKDWGWMDATRIESFVHWLKKNNLEAGMQAEDLYTNQFLSK